jgi:hypothetical protein
MLLKRCNKARFGFGIGDMTMWRKMLGVLENKEVGKPWIEFSKSLGLNINRYVLCSCSLLIILEAAFASLRNVARDLNSGPA